MSVQMTGLTSGMDWDKMIQQLLAIEKRPVKRYENRISETEKVQDAYRDLNNRVSNLMSKVDSLAQADTYDQLSINSSNSDIVGASIVDENKATQGSYEVYVEELATRATRTSGAYIQNQTMAGDDGSGNTFTSRSDFSVSQEGLDPSTDYLSELKNEVETSGSGNWDIEIENATNSANMRIDLDSVGNFQELMDIVNNFDTGHAAVTSSSGTASEFSMKMGYDSAEDEFVMHPTDQTSDGSGGGGDSFTLKHNQGAYSDNSKAFFKQIGFTLDATNHTFDQNQSSYGQNLASIDSSTTFDQALFNIDQTEPEAINDGDSGVIRVANQDIFWSTASGPDSYSNVSYGDERDDADPVNADDPVRSIDQLVQKVTDQIDGVNASYNSATDKITLRAEDPGAGDIELRDLGSEDQLGQNLNLTDTSTFNLQAADTTSGTDAKVNIDGETQTSGDNTLSFDGIRLDLKQLHTSADNPDNPVEINVDQDDQAIAEQVSGFVKQYNSIIEFINNKSEVSVPDEPGSDEERDSGIFVGEAAPRSLKSRLAQMVTDRYNQASGGEINSISELGVEQTDPLYASDTDKGKLEFNASKFQDQLDNNRAAVQDFFTASTADGDPQDGLATRLNSYLGGVTDSQDGMLPTRIDGFDNKIENLQDRIDRQMERIESKKERLESEFIHMEEMLSQLEQQRQGL